MSDFIAGAEDLFEEDVDFNPATTKPKKTRESDFRLQPAIDKKDTECTHQFWMKRCSLCRSILESDSKHNLTPGKADKVMYNELSILVVRFNIAKYMNQRGIHIHSKLTWVISPEGLVVLRSDISDYAEKKDFSFIPAPTSGELAYAFRKYPAKMTEKAWPKIGRNAHKPDAVARILIRIHSLNRKVSRHNLV